MAAAATTIKTGRFSTFRTGSLSSGRNKISAAKKPAAVVGRQKRPQFVKRQARFYHAYDSGIPTIRYIISVVCSGAILRILDAGYMTQNESVTAMALGAAVLRAVFRNLPLTLTSFGSNDMINAG